jgi:hypothetical protein
MVADGNIPEVAELFDGMRTGIRNWHLGGFLSVSAIRLVLFFLFRR